METNITEDYIEFISSDNNGEFKVIILKDCSQLQIETNDGYSYIDISFKELKEIRNCINEALDVFEKK